MKRLNLKALEAKVNVLEPNEIESVNGGSIGTLVNDALGMYSVGSGRGFGSWNPNAMPGQASAHGGGYNPAVMMAHGTGPIQRM
ncbi:MAG: hypothetical protein AAFQ20_11665 [Bacteroidota bacterium]